MSRWRKASKKVERKKTFFMTAISQHWQRDLPETDRAGACTTAVHISRKPETRRHPRALPVILGAFPNDKN
jgi:hypothetical protein